MARSRRACPEHSRGNPGDACWQMLFRAFQPQTTGQIKKVTSFERTRISSFTTLTRATYVVLPKENHMHLTEAATLDRKSGEAEGSAVPRTLLGNDFSTERTRISCHAALDMATCAAFVKESRMKIANATKLTRKPGGSGVERSAVSSNLQVN